MLNCFSAFLYTVGTELNDSPLSLQKTSCKGDVKKAQTAKKAEKYKKAIEKVLSKVEYYDISKKLLDLKIINGDKI